MKERNLAFDYNFEEIPQEEEFSKEALNMLDHIAELLAEEYVNLIKEQKEEK